MPEVRFMTKSGQVIEKIQENHDVNQDMLDRFVGKKFSSHSMPSLCILPSASGRRSKSVTDVLPDTNDTRITAHKDDAIEVERIGISPSPWRSSRIMCILPSVMTRQDSTGDEEESSKDDESNSDDDFFFFGQSIRSAGRDQQVGIENRQSIEEPMDKYSDGTDASNRHWRQGHSSQSSVASSSKPIKNKMVHWSPVPTTALYRSSRDDRDTDRSSSLKSSPRESAAGPLAAVSCIAGGNGTRRAALDTEPLLNHQSYRNDKEDATVPTGRRTNRLVAREASLSCISPGAAFDPRSDEQEAPRGVPSRQLKNANTEQSEAQSMALNYNLYSVLDAYVSDDAAGTTELQDAESQMIGHLENTYKLHGGHSKRGNGTPQDEWSLLSDSSESF